MQPVLALLEQLVGFDTISSRSNRALIDYVADYLHGLGIEAQVRPNADGSKASLWATIGPAVDGGIVLAGHSDVVPVEGQPWSNDPFRLHVADGRAYGRGTADMKGFLACVLRAAAHFRDAGLSRPVHIAITFDEEIGCLGAPELIDWIGGMTPRPAIVFVGEPTSMQVVNAHKGIMVCRTEIKGQEAHSSLAHLGVSAVGLAGRAVALLHEIERELALRHTDPRFTPSHTTISVNCIGGGTAVNILAGHAWFEWDTRAIPSMSGDMVRAAFLERLEREIIGPARAQHPGVSAETRVMANTPGLAPEPDGRAEALATRLLGSNRAQAVPYAAEAGQFQHAGYSTVIVGPGSIEQAHKADEFVALDQLALCSRMLERLAEELS